MTETNAPYIPEHASLRARLLVATAGFPISMIDDARQDLVIDCLRRAPKFDNTRGDWEGFVRGVMRNHTTVLIARRSRRIQYEVLAGDLRAHDSDDPGYVFDLELMYDPTRDLQLAIDTQRVLRQLPVHLQDLASMLVDTPINQICTATKRSRSWVYQMIRQLRGAFNEFGLGPGRLAVQHGPIGKPVCTRSSSVSRSVHI